jgi:predicted ATPase
LPNSSQENGYSKNIIERYSIFNNNFQYLSAYRFGPMEIYKRDDLIVQTQRQLSREQGKGEYVVHFLNYYRNEALPIPELLYPLPEEEQKKDPTLETQTEMWLRKISPSIKINIELGANFKLGYKYERVNNRQTEAAAAINTGFGITYILPLFVAILSAHPGALIIIENPEAHIHPGGQAVLMRLISLAAKNGVQIILETHSDHIINGALIAVKDAVLTKEKLSVYFFERNEEEHSAIAHKLKVTETGKIRRPPKGFFDQFDKDLQRLTGI